MHDYGQGESRSNTVLRQVRAATLLLSLLLTTAMIFVLVCPQPATARKSHHRHRPHDAEPVEFPLLPTAIPGYPVRPGELLLLANESYYPTVVKYIEGAEQRIDLALYLFKIGKSQKNRATVVCNSLIRARQRGVLVSVLLERSELNQTLNRQNLETANFLQSNGITVRFENPEVTTHTKVVVIDRRFAFVGSHNLTDSALHANNEMSILIDNPQIAYQLLQYIEGIR